MFAKNTHALRQKQTVIPQLLAAGRRSELVREKHSRPAAEANRDPQLLAAGRRSELVREKHSHALRQKQTVIPSFWPQAVGANLFAKNTLTPYGRSKP
ncbi:hypothetical protein SAMN05444062_111136 [Pseudomonas syringae]|nr:hypothetical protein SAMN05444062_111136 [Pseudomonas syringae]